MAATELSGLNKTGLQRLILSNDLINISNTSPPTFSLPHSGFYIYKPSEWDGFRTDRRRATEETQHGTCPKPAVDYVWSLGREQAGLRWR